MQGAYLAAISIGFSFLHFVNIFPFQKYKYSFKVKVLLAVATAIVTYIICSQHLLIEKVFDENGYRGVVLNHIGHSIFAVYFLALSFAILYILISKYRHSLGVVKIQLGSVMISCIALLIGGVFFNLILAILDVDRYYWLGPYFTIIICFASLHTIKRCDNIR